MNSRMWWQNASRRWVLAAGILGIVVLLNVLGARHHGRLDATVGKTHALSDQTQEVLAGLQEPVKLIAFLESGGDTSGQIVDLLQEYDYASPKVSLELVDPAAEPAKARTYDVQYYNTIVVESGAKKILIEPYNIFAQGEQLYETEFRGEQAVTRALLNLVHQTGATVYFLEGHGEGSLEQDFAETASCLQGEGYTVKSLNLAVSSQVPADASVLILGGPRQDLTVQEVEVLKGYLAGEGRLVALVDPVPQLLPQLSDLLATCGVTLHQDVVVDPQKAFFNDALSPLPTLESHPITDKMIQQEINLALPRCRSLAAVDTPDGRQLTVVSLMHSSDKSWGETDLKASQAERGSEDLNGPLTLAVAVSRPDEAAADTDERAQNDDALGGSSERPWALVVGNSGFARGQAVGFQGNADFLVNGVNWLMGEQQMVTIRPKTDTTPIVAISSGQAALVFYLCAVLLPLAVLGIGLAVWLRRRSG